MLLIFLFSCKNADQKKVYDDQNSGFKTVTVAEAYKLLNANPDGYVLLDVRTPEEIREGKLAGAMELDFQNEKFSSDLDALNTANTYMVYCRSGGRSSSAAEMMVSKGFKNVINVDGGYTGWVEYVNSGANPPLQR